MGHSEASGEAAGEFLGIKSFNRRGRRESAQRTQSFPSYIASHDNLRICGLGGRKCNGGQFFQAADGEVRLGFGGLDRADAGAGGGAIHPDCGEAEGLGGNDVVVDALADVENAMRWGVDAGES